MLIVSNPTKFTTAQVTRALMSDRGECRWRQTNGNDIDSAEAAIEDWCLVDEVLLVLFEGHGVKSAR